MARAKAARPIRIHEDARFAHEEQDREMDESRDPLDESGRTGDDSSEDEEVEESVAEDIMRFENSFKDITKRYRLINRIGEGTFSTVYKAEDLMYHTHENEWDLDEKENSKWTPRRLHKTKRRPRYVAIKKIYVTSSPMRIFNELELLYTLRDSDHVCPLITAFRHQDQVVAVLPYFQHRDFREYFRDMTVPDMRLYFRSLFTALSAVHTHNIIHRDIKPTNFLYNPVHCRGVLVDFGLAEIEGTEWQQCVCELHDSERRDRQLSSHHYANGAKEKQSGVPLYPKNDNRPSKRANRAGTRGFRAPEVLFKCTAQTISIDVWSAGVILLTLLARRFPFFHSADDIDALAELTSIFGRRKITETALQHGQIFETNIPSYNEAGHSFEKLILWSTNRNTRDKDDRRTGFLDADEKEAIQFLKGLLECDVHKRMTADQALEHPFLANIPSEEGADEMVDLIG